MRPVLLTVVVLTIAAVPVTASTAASSPRHAVAQAYAEWLRELRASARTGDRTARFPSPSRAVLTGRLRGAAKRYRFSIVSVRMLHPLQAAPVIVIRSNRRQAISRATPRIIDVFDPRHVTKANPSGFAYEGYFFVAEAENGVPYLATFNHWRAPHVGGGQWAAAERLYPFPHG
jgi:hypothetical protein